MIKKFFLLSLLFINTAFSSNDLIKDSRDISTCYQIRHIKNTDFEVFEQFKNRNPEVNLDIESIEEDLKLKNFYTQYFQKEEPDDSLYLFLKDNNIIGYISLSSVYELKIGDWVFPLEKLTEDLVSYSKNSLSENIETRLLYISFFIESEQEDHQIIFSETLPNFIQNKIFPNLNVIFEQFSQEEDVENIYYKIMADELDIKDPFLKDLPRNKYTYVGAFKAEKATTKTADLLKKIGFVPYGVPTINDTQIFYITNINK